MLTKDLKEFLELLTKQIKIHNIIDENIVVLGKEEKLYQAIYNILDNALKSLNSDYEAKRYKDMALRLPIVKLLPCGSFYEWMKSKGKLGGQHKVPRLSNDRDFIEEIEAVLKKVNI